jgi:Kef-type K+ transport system membrane component KefB
MTVSSQVIYLAVIFTLLVIPKALQRYRIPAPLTSFALGIFTALYSTQYNDDATLGLLATLGISSLFLFAGLEVDLQKLKQEAKLLLAHLLVRLLILFIATWLLMLQFNFSLQMSGLIALALLTPSTGFILDSLSSLGLDNNEKSWVTNKAIAGELLALILLFLVLKSGSAQDLAVSTGALVLLAFGLPLLLVLLGKMVIPHAPGSEFSLLIMVGLIAATITKTLGVYYLVGAFLTGFAARQLREKMPSMASEDNLHAVRLFASFFVPFYFFHGGMEVPEGALQLESLYLGLIITIVLLPLRVGNITLHRYLFHKDSLKSSFKIGVALSPTLIFTLVLANILRERYGINDTLFGGLLVYAALNTILPVLLLKIPMKLDVEIPAEQPTHDINSSKPLDIKQ